MNHFFSFAWKVMFGSWIAFLFLDVLRPGFVSEIFSVHWFLLGAIVCAGISLFDTSSDPLRPSDTSPINEGGIGRVAIGLVLSVLVWRAGEAFGDLRIFLAILAFVLPWGLMRALRD